MKVRITLTIDDMEAIDILHVEREELQSGNLGFSMTEAKSLLACGQKAFVEAQVSDYAQQLRQCPDCHVPLRNNGTRLLTVRTLFGKLPLKSPRFYRCICSMPEAPIRASFSPLADLLPERTVPEYQYLQAKWASLMSYGMTLNLLHDVLPVDDDLSKTALRANASRIVRRLDAELGSEYTSSIQEQNIPAETLPTAPTPVVVGIDGGYVHARNANKKHPRFEVIVGKSVPAQGNAKYFGFVQRTETKPKRRLRQALDSQAIALDQPIVFLSDGADTVRNLQMHMSPNSEHILDWFHMTMRMTVIKNLAIGIQKGIQAVSEPERLAGSQLTVDVESVKWNLWHGKVEHALEKAAALSALIENISVSSENRPKLLTKLAKLIGYITANRAFIPNYGERKRAGKTISTAFAESTVNALLSRRFIKKQQMQWTEHGCHNVLQLRIRVLNNELHTSMAAWYPGMTIAA